MLFTREDCQLLERYKTSVPWGQANEQDKSAIKAIRERLKSLAKNVADEYVGSIDVKPFASHPNPSGRTPRELWCCIFPASVPNKSYALQIAMIVSGQGVEICFCMGAGSAQINKLETRRKCEMSLATMRAGLQSMDLEARTRLSEQIGDGWSLNKQWRMWDQPASFHSFNDWLEYVADSEGNSSSISKFYPTEELEAIDVAQDYARAAELFQPLLDAAYEHPDVVESAIPPFIRLMNELSEENAVLQSPKQGSRYCIGEVDERGCSVMRLDSESPARVTASAFESRLAWLHERGGEALREELDNTVATQVCFLQMPELGLKADRRTVIAFRSDQERADNFISLLQPTRSVKLYKPVILQLVIEAIRDEKLVDNNIQFDWLLPRFISRMRDLGRDVSEQQLAEGFGRLANDLFWLLAHRDTSTLLDTLEPTAATVRERVSHARLQEAYWQMLQDSDIQARILEAIDQKWWPTNEIDGLTDEEEPDVNNDDINMTPETNLPKSAEKLIEAIQARGYVFQPWQIATYVTALRTKPFVILAGVSGTGKSKLPALIAELTTGEINRISVRPDWTDSSDVLGYVDLQNHFRPGVVLEAARNAATDNLRFHVCLLDEMNLARVEHYFAEVLSSIEDRRRSQTGGFESTKLVAQALPATYREWQEQTLPANFGIVGTVNMDESSHGFSRKVLDRAFTLELSEVDLDLDQSAPLSNELEPVYWPPSFWHCRATRISECDQNAAAFRPAAEEATEALKTVNQSLVHSQLQVGYRTRDEVILFLLNANELIDSFVTRDGKKVDPLDLALMMKVLPRLVGGSNAIRRTMIGLLGFAHGQAISESEDAEAAVESWVASGRPDAIVGARFPRTASRLCLMWERLTSEGYTSFWL